MALADLGTDPQRIIYARLDEQITWYERHSIYHKRMYKLLKGLVILAGALTPVCAALHLPAALTGGLGVAAVFFESIQQLNQHHQNWLTYRSTGEALKHEKYLFLAAGGAYALQEGETQAQRLPLLAERMEQIISQATQRWLSAQELAHTQAAGKRDDNRAQPACRYVPAPALLAASAVTKPRPAERPEKAEAEPTRPAT